MKLGFNENYPEDKYHAFDALSSSQLKMVGNGAPWSKGSPALYKYHQDNPDSSEQNHAQKQGTILHTMILEPEKANKHFAITDLNLATKAGKAFKEDNVGKTIIKEWDYEKYEYIKARVYENNHAKQLLSSGLPEVSMLWEDKIYNLTCRGRVDYLRAKDNHIIDLKTTSETNPLAWQRSARFWQYNIQAAFYSRGYHIITDATPRFSFISVQTVPPYEVTVHETDKHFLTEGTEYIIEALELFNKCKKYDYWPGHCETGKALLTASEFYYDNNLMGKEKEKQHASGNV